MLDIYSYYDIMTIMTTGNFTMNSCKRCSIPEGKFNVVLDESGICNYCNYFEKHKADTLNVKNREKILVRKFEKYRGKYKYDAVVGLSGGKDSTYVLCQLVDKYKLKVQAVTFDNGFLTDFARESITNTVEKLGVDHHVYQPDWDVHRKFYKATVRRLFDPCIACGIGGYFLAIKACHEMQIPLFIHGRSPFQMYRNFYQGSKDIFLPMMKLNLMGHSLASDVYCYLGLLKSAPLRLIPKLIREGRGSGFGALHRYIYYMVNEYVRQYISGIAGSPEEAKQITDEFFIESSKLLGDFVPEFLGYFLFEDYDEEKIKAYLADTLGWKRPAFDNLLGHYDCGLHDAGSYMFQALNGVDVIEPDVAVMLRFGEISKEKADELKRANQPTEKNLEKSLDSLCSLCELSREDLDEILVTLKRDDISKFDSR